VDAQENFLSLTPELFHGGYRKGVLRENGESLFARGDVQGRISVCMVGVSESKEKKSL
jgi:hypothetical protein